jgi:hypothetical protein
MQHCVWALCQAQGTFVAALCEYTNAVHGTSFTEAQFFSYHFADVWKCEEEEVRRYGASLASFALTLFSQYRRTVVSR